MKSVTTRAIPILLLAACGCSPAAPPPPPASPALVRPAPVASVPVVPQAPRALSLPANAPWSLSVDPSRLSVAIAALVHAAKPDLTLEIRRWAGLAASDSAALADAWGVDPQQPIALAAAPLDEGGRAIIAAAREAAKANAGTDDARGIARRMEEAFWGHKGVLSHLRMIVPVRDADRFSGALGSALDRAEFKRLDPPPDVDALYARRQRVVVVWREPGKVVVDAVLVVGDVPVARLMSALALASLRALNQQAQSGGAPLPIEGHLAHMAYAPDATAALVFAESIGSLHDAVRRFDEETRNRLWGRGLDESSSVLELASRDGAAYFRSVDLTIDLDTGGPRLTCRSELGPALPAVDSAAWAPSSSVEFPGALARFDISTAAMKAFSLPGDAPGNLAAGSRFDRMVAAGGWAAWPAALPSAALAATREPLRWNAGVGPRAMLRFERFGWANPAFGQPDVFWGLLPASAGPEDLACAVDEQGPGCRGRRRIAPRRINDVGGAWVRPVQVGARVVVLASRDKKAVAALVPAATPGPVPPLRAVVSQGTLRRLLDEAGLDSRGSIVVASASLADRTLTTTVRLSESP